MGNSYSVAREEQEEEEFQRLVEAVDIAQQRSAGQVDLENGLGVGYPFLGHGSLRNTIPYASPDYDRLHEHYRSIFKPSQGGPGIGLDSISARAPGSVAAPVPGPCFPETAPPAEALPPTIVGVPPAQVIVPPHTAEIPQGAAVEIPPYSGDIIWTEIDHYRHHRRATSGDLSPPPARNDWPIDMTSGVSHALMEEYALGHRSTSPASRTGSLALSASSHAPLPGAEYHQPSELHDRAESPSHSSLDQPAHDEPSPHSGTQLDHVSRLADRAEQQDRRSRSSSLKSVVARPCDSDEMLASGRSWESYKSSEQYRPPAAATSEESIVIPHHASEHSPGPQQLRMKPRSRSQSIISHHTWQRAHDAENVVHDDNDGQARRLSSTKSSISSRSHERTRARSYSRKSPPISTAM
ncbi:hypothetical protein L226DRAFT_145851 [Lentinus tigrinus ALCF2SS1-7]|uniref:Uncharacterized protein n=1 Tax=Lentinus tigrinus ALCF2SS1-6 TaxID=1328759 RepID=A0A5C2SBD5_9APHY|nr:hypothetical protein L227DRAFT_550428 [Lentinus tigrinus ALCF2SS1-6]RPD72747.1 hypothetical protein L226DRAFT_145851 [Lentinus tigrinus ALCF2SS1-7]